MNRYREYYEMMSPKPKHTEIEKLTYYEKAILRGQGMHRFPKLAQEHGYAVDVQDDPKKSLAAAILAMMDEISDLRARVEELEREK